MTTPGRKRDERFFVISKENPNFAIKFDKKSS
jgi:hypothetical protein